MREDSSPEWLRYEKRSPGGRLELTIIASGTGRRVVTRAQQELREAASQPRDGGSERGSNLQPGVTLERGGEPGGWQSCCPSIRWPADLRKSDGTVQASGHRAKWVPVGTPKVGRFFLKGQKSLVGDHLCIKAKWGLRLLSRCEFKNFDFHHWPYASARNNMCSAAQKLSQGL